MTELKKQCIRYYEIEDWSKRLDEAASWLGLSISSYIRKAVRDAVIETERIQAAG